MAKKPSKQGEPSPALKETIEEIMRVYNSLPTRPSIEEVEAAMSVIKTSASEEQTRLEEISKQECPSDVPEELFGVLKQVRRAMVLFRGHDERKDAIHLVQADKLFETFDGLIQKASSLVSGGDFESCPVERIQRGIVGTTEVLINKVEGGESEQENGWNGGLAMKDSTANATFVSDEAETEKLSLMKVASIIENSAKTGAVVLDLKEKLMDNIEWLPLSLGKLSALAELYLSGNRTMALPHTIGSLRALTTLDIHSNQLINLPNSFGELINLTNLDLHANRLKSLPVSFGNLRNLLNLDLSSNQFTYLPDTIGGLTSLKFLSVETNELEEISNAIGYCSLLIELRLDFNELKALPEAVGKLKHLEILTVHYNRIKKLPTTVCNLSSLRELDVSFNELESLPEGLCLAVNLIKLNVGKNFADLRALPRTIGHLKNLEELDISDNQIRLLPESFRFLSKLRVFRADETPLEVPPRQVTKLGAQAVVEFMGDLVAKRNTKSQPSKKKGFWSRVCSLFFPF